MWLNELNCRRLPVWRWCKNTSLDLWPSMVNVNGWKCEWMEVFKILPFSRFAPPSLGHQAPPPPIQICFMEGHTASLHLPLLRLHPPLVLLTFSGKGKIWGDYVTLLWRMILPISQAFRLPFSFFSPSMMHWKKWEADDLRVLLHRNPKSFSFLISSSGE